MLHFYHLLTKNGKPLLRALLERRIQASKEDPERLDERKGKPGKNRPSGPLVWIHAASVGEAQSALILINVLLKYNDNLHVLVTTGTLTSAQIMASKLPKRAFHQFYPLDHPDWVENFLNHWKPDLILWMESELWPNMLQAIQTRNIPAALVNARLSDKSYKRWRLMKKSAYTLLKTFSIILTQTQKDAERFLSLGAENVKTTDNLKYSARSLPISEESMEQLSAYTRGRNLWLFASTHKGEEEMACRIHQILKNAIPDILTIIVPRHPERRDEIQSICEAHNLSVVMRGEKKCPPDQNTDIYVADTMGELGLFYRLSPVACIGRSFSDDGGGGHNPIEAAQLNCAVLHGPNIQYQKQIYAEMNEEKAAFKLNDENELANTVRELLSTPQELQQHQKNALEFAQNKEGVVEYVLQALGPLLEQAKIIEGHKLVKQA